MTLLLSCWPVSVATEKRGNFRTIEAAPAQRILPEVFLDGRSTGAEGFSDNWALVPGKSRLLTRSKGRGCWGREKDSSGVSGHWQAAFVESVERKCLRRGGKCMFS